MSIIAGKKLMAFVKDGTDYVSVGYATNHTLSLSTNTIDVAHKDLADTSTGNAKWVDEDIDTLTWSISTEAFFSSDPEGQSFEDLFDLFAAGSVIDLKFGLTEASTTGVPTGGWTPSTGSGDACYSGKAIISSLNLNAPVSEKASWSVTFTGKGALTKL